MLRSLKFLTGIAFASTLHAQDPSYTAWRLTQPLINTPMSNCPSFPTSAPGAGDNILVSTICFVLPGPAVHSQWSLLEPVTATSKGGSVALSINQTGTPARRYRFSWTFDQDVGVMFLNRPITVTLNPIQSLDCVDPKTCDNLFLYFGTIGNGISYPMRLTGEDIGDNRFYVFESPFGPLDAPIYNRKFRVISDKNPLLGFQFDLAFFPRLGGTLRIAYRYQGEVAGGACAGTCSLNPPGQLIPASGGSGTISVTATSTWMAATGSPWIHIASGSSGSGNGTITFSVDPNTGPSRTDTISVGGQTTTIVQNGTPAGTAGCNYLIQSSTTQNVAVGGGNGLIQIVTAQNCPWTSSTGASWITLNSGASSVGNGAVSYTAAANTTGNARSGSILVAGQNVVVNQVGGVPPGTPAIASGGIVDAASYAPGGPPNGLGQGSFFSIFGTSLGPDQPIKANTYPLPSTLSGVGVKITQGSNTYDAPLVFVSATQINGIIPSNVALGNAQVTVSYNGKTSALATMLVSKTSLGVFFQVVNGNNLAIAQNVASATDYPLNLPSAPAQPGQIVILWGTGLGPENGPDNVAPGANASDLTGVPVTITVGGVTAQRLYAGRQSETAGVDNIYFKVPAGVPFGCNVPVAITAGGIAANTTTIAISADGSPCQ